MDGCLHIRSTDHREQTCGVLYQLTQFTRYIAKLESHQGRGMGIRAHHSRAPHVPLYLYTKGLWGGGYIGYFDEYQYDQESKDSWYDSHSASRKYRCPRLCIARPLLCG
eukprot:1188392-Prorocentrum_minimum.AAC.4